MLTAAQRRLPSVAAHYHGALARAFSRASAQTSVSTDARHINRLSYRSYVARATQWAAQLDADYTRNVSLMTVDQMVARPDLSPELLGEGDEVVRQMRSDMNQLRPEPTDFQRSIIETVIEMMAPRIYGELWKTDELAIKRRNGWTNEYHGIGAVLTGRKEGKSTALAMSVVIVMLNIRAVRIALFSKTKPQACIILNMAKPILAAHPRSAAFKMSTSAQTIVALGGPNDERHAQAYTGTADVRTDGARGGGHTRSLLHV